MRLENIDSLQLFKISIPPLTKRWKELIEARVELMRPHMDKFTLQRMGDIQCCKNDLECPKFRDHAQFRTPIELSKETHGIYYLKDTTSETPIDSVGHMKFWGLTKNTKWISAEVTFFKQKMTHGSKNWRINFAPVDVNFTSLEELLPVWGSTIWAQLGLVIREWHTKAEDRFKTTSDLLDTVQMQDMLVRYSRYEV